MPTTTAKAAPKKRATKKAAAATTEGTPLTEKRCPGVASVGREPHVAPVDQFHKNVQHKDGLSRLCKTCNTLYTAHLRAQKAAKEATAAEAPAAEPTPVAAEQPADDPAATSAVASLMEMPATPAPKPSDGEPAARRQRAARERQLARAGGAESEAGQALLAQWAAESRKATRDARKGQKA